MGTRVLVGKTHLQTFLALSALLICTVAVAADDRQAFFGDLHTYTQNSADAFLSNSGAMPDDAYRYAQG